MGQNQTFEMSSNQPLLKQFCMKLVKFGPSFVICLKKSMNYVKMAKICSKYTLGHGASAKIRPLAKEILAKIYPWRRKDSKGDPCGGTPPPPPKWGTHNKQTPPCGRPPPPPPPPNEVHITSNTPHPPPTPHPTTPPHPHPHPPPHPHPTHHHPPHHHHHHHHTLDWSGPITIKLSFRNCHTLLEMASCTTDASTPRSSVFTPQPNSILKQ